LFALAPRSILVDQSSKEKRPSSWYLRPRYQSEEKRSFWYFKLHPRDQSEEGRGLPTRPGPNAFGRRYQVDVRQ
jgi:hypothetical protein